MNLNPQYIFLFILDAVRKDHLSLYGYPRKTSPNIDKLAQQANIYQWAFAPSSYTLASVPSILAGKYPIELSNMFTANKFTVKDFENLLNLKKQGYKTAMFTANIVTSSKLTNLNEFFDFFWDNLTEKELNRKDILFQKANVVIKAVEDFILKNKKEKLFIVVHLMEAHGPYTPWVESIFKGDKIYKKDKRKIERVVNNMFSGANWELLKQYKIVPRYQLLNLVEAPNGEIEDFNPNINEYIAKYDMGIYLMDKELGNFLQFLEKKEIFDKSKIIITADHGETMGEENIFFIHGSLTHPVLTNIPLIIKNFKQNKKNIINDNFSLIQILGNNESLKDIYIFHPQTLSFLDNNFYINIHNSELSHNGALYQNIFATADFNFYQIIDNFIQLKQDIKIKIYKKDKKTLGFKEIKNHQHYIYSRKIIDIFINLQRYNFKSLELKLDDQIRSLHSQLQQQQSHIQNLETQINQQQSHIQNLETQLNTIKS
ncbi:MAG: sulfatase-like hydrolase/transferase, partial [Microgenomates group bacterium]